MTSVLFTLGRTIHHATGLQPNVIPSETLLLRYVCPLRVRCKRSRLQRALFSLAQARTHVRLRPCLLPPAPAS
jgi:hypothetical protein